MRSKLPVTGNSETYPPSFRARKRQNSLNSPLPRGESFAGLGQGDDHPLPAPRPKRAGSRVKGWPFLALLGCPLETRF
jgi:hypothetical protein